jgi:cytochrome c-type biogenesis protein CcmH
MKRYTLPLWCALLAAAVHAGEAVPVASDPALEARTLQIASELRCLVCQNQTIADSHSGLAIDLRQEIRTLLAQGQDESAVRRFMTDRYGDFVLYKPPVRRSTWFLWFGPPVLLLLGGWAFRRYLKTRRQHALANDPDDSMPDAPTDTTTP